MGHGKWQMAGPKLNLTVSSGMKSFNIPEYEGKTLIMAML
jgi:beta-lactam-binding protein with PASTA domain